ncbi:DUF1450 domain-containing protein [Cohnella terricola]|uniref:DUF1450 domain-containing protein n=1 Tax=Cohnella terricola TaxID=1289167 RepID=A0A559JLA6_9BACL|nr:DUF1450 domain-containing protein [Cohnella terricola]TVY00663.1 DUF1450 domain-containing protein [Cohnella terricola]
MKKIKFCCRNFKHGSKSVYKSLKIEYPEIKRKKKDCIGVCKACTRQCVALIGKTEMIAAPTPEALFDKLKLRIG